MRQNAVKLYWETGSELNNDYYTIERSSNIQDWETIGKVNGNGTVNYISEYEFFDEMPVGGMNYYRLKQTDYDGAFKNMGIIAVEFTSNSDIEILYSDNNSGIVLQMNNCKTDVFVKIFDVSGKLLASSELKQGISKEEIEIKSLYGSGIFIVSVFNGGNTLVKKVSIN